MSQREPISFFEFQERFASEEACYQYLFEMRWPEGFCCPHCGHKEHYFVSKRHLYQCKSCNYQASLTARTVFHKTHTTLQKWFWAIFLVVTDKRGYSALALMKTIDVSYPTAWLMLQKIRAAMSKRDQMYQLSGLIQLDEAFFGSPDGKQGRGTDKMAAYVAVSTTDEGKPLYAKIEVTERVNKETALDFVTRAVSPGSTITTDGLNVYPQLKDQNYVHEKVLSCKAEFGEKLHWVHTLVSNAKAFIVGTYHGLDKKHLQAYLDEFCFRFNRRAWQSQLFGHLLSACVNGPIVTYADLTL